MTSDTITCPKCGAEIDLSDAVMSPFKEGIRKELLREERGKAEKQVAVDLEDLHTQLKEKEELLEEAHKKELELRKQQREVERKAKETELEVSRKLDEERKKIAEDVAMRISEEHQLKDKEKDTRIQRLLKKIDEMKASAEQGSQQLQGEVLEDEVERQLRESFRDDQIVPVKTGARGADVIQKVFTRSGTFCGSILWESKRTKNWSDKWISKLNDDKRNEGADLGAIVSIALPEDIKSVGGRDGVVIAGYEAFVPVASLLRRQLIEVAGAKQSLIGRGEKTEMLYEYVNGTEFRNNVEAVVGAFIGLKRDLDKEKRAVTRMWAKREKEIDKVVQGVATMYGDMSGIVGASMPQIKALELKELPPGEDNDLNDEHTENE